MARNLVESIIARKDQPFDAQWMTETFERFYARYGGITYIFNNLLLEPITTAGKQLLIAQYGSDGRARQPRPTRLKSANAFLCGLSPPVSPDSPSAHGYTF